MLRKTMSNNHRCIAFTTKHRLVDSAVVKRILTHYLLEELESQIAWIDAWR